MIINKKTAVMLIAVCAISLSVNLYHSGSVPPCLNPDEAAFGYNAYSLLKTARDEYGTFLPLRLKSFGDYKLPLYSYLSIPFIAFGGLNEMATRAANSALAFAFPIIIYLLVKELFGNKEIAVLSALLVSLAPGLQMIGRQAHEAYAATFFICLSLYLLFASIRNNRKIAYFLLSLIPLSLGYQFSRLWLGIMLLISAYYFLRKNLRLTHLLAIGMLVAILGVPDLLSQPARVKNLLFTSNIGFSLQINELRAEGAPKILYNKLTWGIKRTAIEHLNYFSPQFLVGRGDENIRFGFPGISPIGLVEYLFVFAGLYYLFKNKEKNRNILILLLVLSPLSGSLSWAGISLTRSLPLIIFLCVIAAYGFYNFYFRQSSALYRIAAGLLVLSYIFTAFYSWDFYYHHYPQRAVTIRSWQCGNKEMALYIKNNYAKFDRFYITRRNSMPYIFLLYFFPYLPQEYQKQAVLSSPDEFGFGQVEKFDKFVFHYEDPGKVPHSAVIGYPDEFPATLADSSHMKKIKVGTEEIFWIYENGQKSR